jgi:hypothetical protein
LYQWLNKCGEETQLRKVDGDSKKHKLKKKRYLRNTLKDVSLQKVHTVVRILAKYYSYTFIPERKEGSCKVGENSQIHCAPICTKTVCLNLSIF